MPSLTTIFWVSAGLFIIVFMIGCRPSDHITPKWFAAVGVALFLIAVVTGLITGIEFLRTGLV